MRTFIFVISAHLLLLALAAYHHPPKSKVTPHSSVKVQTVVFKKEEPKRAPKPAAPISVAPSKPAEKPPAPISAAPSKSPAKPLAKPSPISTAKKEISQQPNREKLLSMVEESLQKLDTPTSKSVMTPTKQISSLASENLSFTANYQGDLISYLQQLLTLPEKGDVKIELILKRNGSVQNLSILTASNDRNRTYIETKLLTLSFPPFGSHFKGENSHAFKITLTSEDSH